MTSVGTPEPTVASISRRTGRWASSHPAGSGLPGVGLRRAALALPAAVAVVVLAACGGSSSTATPSPSEASAAASALPTAEPTVAAAAGPVRDTKVGVKVTGDLGDKPLLTVPTSAAPTQLSAQVLSAGTGPVVAKGQTLVANYLGQTWAPEGGKPNIFDNSYDRRQPASFEIGAGKVIAGWDEALVGQKAGSRVLLTIPPAKAYGASPDASQPLSGKALLFVVDVLAGLDKDAAATGTVVSDVPAGFPAVTSASGAKPEITSVAGVKPSPGSGTQTQSTLLIKGSGAPIDPEKSLALQIVQTDTATGKQKQETWGSALQLVPAKSVLEIAKALDGASVGSRALVVTPQSEAQPSVVLVLDVVGQY